MLFLRNKKKKKKPIHDISSGLVPGVIHLRRSWISTYLGRFYHPLYVFPALFLIVALLVLTFGSSFSRATFATYYFSSCLGGWENPFNAAGESEITGPDERLDETNSAVLSQSVQPIFCGSVQGEPIPNTLVRSAKIKLVMNLRDKDTLQVEVNQDLVSPEGVLVPESHSVNENIETSSTQDSSPVGEPTQQPEAAPQEEPNQPPAEAPAQPPEETPPAEAPAEPIQESQPEAPAPEPEPSAPAEAPAEPTSFLFNLAHAQEGVAVEPEPTPAPEPESTPEPEAPAPADQPSSEASEPQSGTEQAMPEPSSTSEPVSPADESQGGDDVSEPATSTPESSSAVSVEEAETEVIVTGQASDDAEPFLEALYTFDGSNWTSLGTIGRSNWQDVEYDIPVQSWEDLASLQVNLQGFKVVDDQPNVYLESIPIEIEYEPLEEFVGLDENNLEDLPTVELPPGEVFDSDKSNFGTGESIELEINPSPEVPEIKEEGPREESSWLHRVRVALSSFFTPDVYAKNSDKGNLISVDIYDPGFQKSALRPIVDDSGDKIKVKISRPSGRQIIPGEYSIKIRMLKDDVIVESTETFTWGVLGLNVRRAYMTPGEAAFLQIAALDKNGHTLCDANLRLQITNTSSGDEETFTTADNTIIKQPTCGDYINGNVNNYTEDPDYTALFVPKEEGEYMAVLTNLDTGYSISDKLNAKGDVSFIVERTGPTRLAPFLGLPYSMTIKIDPKENFNGEIVETVNRDFDVLPSESYQTRRSNTGDTEVVWQATTSPGQIQEFSYLFRSPQVSPMLYLAGPVKLYSTSPRKLIFADAREWRFASDAACVSGAVTGNWSAEATWTDASCGANHYPGQGGATTDTVTITEGDTITLDTTTTIAGLTICDTGCATSTFLTHSSTNGLTINGTVTVNGGSGAGDTGQWNINAGSATVSGNISYNPQATNAGRDAQINITTGTLNANGGITFEATSGMADNQQLNISGSGSVSLKGAMGPLSISGVAVADINPGTTSTFNYSDTSAGQTVVFEGTSPSTAATYAKLQISNTSSSGATLGAAITSTNVTDNVMIASGTLNNGNFAITGNTSKTFTVNSNATFKMTGTNTGVAWPTGFSTYSIQPTSNVYYNHSSNITISAQSYGNLFLAPNLSGSATYTAEGSASISVAGNLTINPTKIINSPALTLALATTSARSLSVTGTTTITNTNGATSVLNTDSTNNNSFSSGHIDIESGGTLTANASTITLTATEGTLFTRNSGTFTAGTSEVIMRPDASVTLTSGAFTGSNKFNKLTLSPTIGARRTYTFGHNVETGDEFKINPTASSALELDVALGGSLTVPATASTTLTRTTSATSVLMPNATGTSYTISTGFMDILAGATLDASTSNQTITLTGTSGTLLVRDSGTFTAGSSEVIANPDASVNVTSGAFTSSNAFYKLTLSPTLSVASRTYTFGGAIDTSSNFSISPTLNDIGTLSVNMGGDITVASTATTTITQTGSSSAKLDTRPSSTDYNFTTGHLDIQSGGTLDAASSASLITINGDYANSGTFTAGNSTTTLSGSSKQTLTGTMTGSSAFYNLVISNTSGTAPSDCERTSFVPGVDFGAAASSTNNYFITSGGVKVEYNSGSGYTFQNIRWTGASGNVIYFRNSAASSAWLLYVPGTRYDITYLDVSRSNAGGTTEIDASGTGNVNCNNNTNWSFGGNSAPTLSNGTFNGGNNITLIEGTAKYATSTFLITDAEYCNTISSVTAKAYLASTSNSGTACSSNDLNCYVSTGCLATTTGNTCDASDTTVEYDCGFTFWYIALPTDSGTWASSIWSSAATATDSGGLTGTATNTVSSQEVEINTLKALNVTSSINYGTLGVGDTSAQQTVYATSTGNVPIDVSVQATNDMCNNYPTCNDKYIISTQEHYSLNSGDTWNDGSALASSSAANVDTTIAAPTATSSDPFDIFYWFLKIPAGTTGTNYTGINVFTAIDPI